MRGYFGFCLALLLAVPAAAQPLAFSTGNPDGRMAMASRPSSGGGIEIEAADDFILGQPGEITYATFTGLLPTGQPLSIVSQVTVEFYRVFPKDSNTGRTPDVPTRTNSPSDVEFVGADSGIGSLSFVATLLNANFTAANSVLNGINPSPAQTTGGEGPVSGQEVLFSVMFHPPISLPPDHYFFIPQVLLSTGNFFWLSAPKPIVAPGTPFSPDLQTWIRNANLDPDWLRVGTDIVGGITPPTFNGTFSLSGLLSCPPHTVHGHISTLPPGHTGVVSHEHHGQHGHTVAFNCPPHAPGHTPGLMPEPREDLFSFNLQTEPVFVAAVNQDGTPNPVRPAPRGVWIDLFGSADSLFLAEGDRPASQFTAPRLGGPLYYTTALPEVRIGGVPAEVLFSGLAPGLTGVWQIRVGVPDGVAGGVQAVEIFHEGQRFPSVDIAVQ